MGIRTSILLVSRVFPAAVLLLAVVPGVARAIPIETLTGVLASGRPVEVVAGQVLVRFSAPGVEGTAGPGGSQAAALREAALVAERSRALTARGAADSGEVAHTGWTLVDLPPGMKVSEGLSWLKTLPGVAEVEPNHVLRVNRTPNDPQFSSQWALQQVSAAGAWEYELGGSSRVTVAVIDVGIDGTHDDLSGKLVGTSKSFDPTIAGMSWGAGLLSLKVFRGLPDCDLTENGCQLAGCATSIAAVANAIAHAQTLHNTAAIGKVVINMSIGDSVPCPGTLQTAVTDAVNAGLLLVASAGNDGDDVMSPANCVGVIPVGATDQSDAVASFSSRGPEMSANGLVAPGVSVLTTTPGDGYSGATGTSFASPMVAGAAALVWSARPGFAAHEVKQTLRLSADNIGVLAMGSGGGRAPSGERSATRAYEGLAPLSQVMAELSGAGRLNAFRAVRMAVRGSQTDFDLKAIAFPNPFRLAQDGQVTLSVPVSVQGSNRSIKIYNAVGGFVKEINGTTWDGKNAAGQRVASGVYTFVVTTDRGTAVGRLTVVR
ncbi:MAG: S8 family serine peptidase [Elusimicrobia bacterium]|nr:S8 family serine peptidase [Elusimicrobiota bacterium]